MVSLFWVAISKPSSNLGRDDGSSILCHVNTFLVLWRCCISIFVVVKLFNSNVNVNVCYATRGSNLSHVASVCDISVFLRR